MSALSIRLANKQDAAALAALEVRAFDTARYHLMNRAQYRRLLTKGNADVLVAEQGGAICGALVILYRRISYFGRMYSIAVDPDFQGGDVGKSLFDTMERMVNEKGLKGVILEIRDDNKAHFERYARLGYTENGRVSDYYPDGRGCIKMKKEF